MSGGDVPPLSASRLSDACPAQAPQRAAAGHVPVGPAQHGMEGKPRHAQHRHRQSAQRPAPLLPQAGAGGAAACVPSVTHLHRGRGGLPGHQHHAGGHRLAHLVRVQRAVGELAVGWVAEWAGDRSRYHVHSGTALPAACTPQPPPPTHTPPLAIPAPAPRRPARGHLVHALDAHARRRRQPLAAQRAAVLEVQHGEGCVALGKAAEEHGRQAQRGAQQRLVDCGPATRRGDQGDAARTVVSWDGERAGCLRRRVPARPVQAAARTPVPALKHPPSPHPPALCATTSPQLRSWRWLSISRHASEARYHSSRTCSGAARRCGGGRHMHVGPGRHGSRTAPPQLSQQRRCLRNKARRGAAGSPAGAPHRRVAVDRKVGGGGLPVLILLAVQRPALYLVQPLRVSR